MDDLIYEEYADAGEKRSARIPRKTPRKKMSRRARNEEICGTIMAIIPVIGRLLFSLIPIALAIVMAFYQMKTPVSFTGAKFVGFDNFVKIFADANFTTSLLNTLVYAITLPVSLALALGIASVLNSDLVQTRAKGVFRVILFLPFICSTIAIVYVWKWMYDANYGIINTLLGTDIAWLKSSPWLFRISIIVMMVWSTTGYKIVLLAASLTSVNASYYEAAEIDGAGPLQKFLHITVPAVSPTTLFLLITGLVSIFQMFSETQVMDPTGGSSVGMAGLTVVFYLYRYGFNYNQMGMACAAAFVLSLIILAITVLQFKLSKRWVRYD
ncbi:MAG: carbohydrate ABC transporter permease [Candidatus Gallimonas sp.]